jgi:hypothetical protein
LELSGAQQLDNLIDAARHKLKVDVDERNCDIIKHTLEIRALLFKFAQD